MCQYFYTFTQVFPQEAVAEALDVADQPYEGFPNFYDWLVNSYEKKRNRLIGRFNSLVAKLSGTDYHCSQPPSVELDWFPVFLREDFSSWQTPG